MGNEGIRHSRGKNEYRKIRRRQRSRLIKWRKKMKGKGIEEEEMIREGEGIEQKEKGEKIKVKG